MFRDNRLLMNMFLEAQQDLTWVNRLDEIIGYLFPDSLLHDMLFLAFRDHYHGHFRMDALEFLQRFQTCHTGHVLIEKNDVARRSSKPVKRIFSIACCYNFVAFIF